MDHPPWEADKGFDGMLNPFNLGTLPRTGYYTDPQGYYCPSQQLQRFREVTYYPQPWGETPFAVRESVRLAYQYNPYRDPLFGGTRVERLELFPPRRILSMDLLEQANRIPHHGVWQLLRGDGSARGYAYPLAVTELETVGQVDRTTDWGRFEALRVGLEAMR